MHKCNFIDTRKARAAFHGSICAKDVNGEHKNAQISRDRTDCHPSL